MRLYLLYISLLLVLPLHAEQGGFVNDSSSVHLHEAVVSATRWQQDIKQQPRRITLITSDMQRFENPQTAADLLGMTGQVYIQKSQQGGGSPMIRGFAANRLLYAVDGVRMNTAIFRAGNLQNVISLDPFAIASTEVCHGLGSVLYGSDAIGGVMSFQTLTPQLSSSAEIHVSGTATARYASANDERTVHADVQVGRQQWALLTSITASHYDDLRQGRHGPTDYLKLYLVERHNNKGDVVINNPDPLVQSPSAYSQINVMQKIRYRPTEAWQLQYALHYSETSPYARYDRHTRLRNGLPRYAEWDYGPQLWLMHHLSAVRSIGTKWYDALTCHAALQHFEESRIDRTLNKVDRTTQTERVKAYSLNADFVKKLTPTHQLYYGAEWVYNRVKSSGQTTNIETQAASAAPSRYPQAHWSSYAAYVQGELRLDRTLQMHWGVRYSHYALRADFTNHGYPFPFAPKTKQHRGSFSADIGLSYRPDEASLLTLQLARGFRAPNVDDMGKLFDVVDRAVVVPNTALRPEYAHNIEIGISRRFGRLFDVELSAYYTYLNDALVRRPYHLNGQDSVLYKDEMSQVLAVQNAASAYVCGLQASWRMTLPGGFGARVDLNWQQGREELDNGTRSPLRHAAPFFGRAALTYAHGGLALSLYSTFQARRSHADMAEEEKAKTEIYARNAAGKTYSPAWLALHFKASLRCSAHWHIGAGVENITDRRYRLYSSGISAAGRNVIISATYRF